MPQSIYDNGGMIGNTLDFADTGFYPGSPIDPEAGLTLTRTEAASSSISAYSATERNQNAVFSADVTFPTSPSDGCLFEWGRNAIGAFVGLRDGGTVFRVRAGDGSGISSSNEICAMLDITDFPTDGAAHNVTVDFQINPGRVRLWIDGIFKGESFTVGNGPLESDDWAGGAVGSYLSTSSDNGPIYEPIDAWPGTEQGTGLRFYANQLVIETPITGNLKNSGIWSLGSALESIFPVVNSNTTLNYIAHQIDGNSLTSYDFSVDFSVISGTGLAVVVIHNETASGANPPTQVTIDGIAAVKAAEANSVDTASSHASIWYSEVSSGVKTVSVQYSTAPLRTSVGSYSIENYTSTTPIFIGFSEYPIRLSSRTIQTEILGSGNSIIAAQTSGDQYVHTWSGLTENYDEQLAGITGGTSASTVTASTGAVRVTVAPGGEQPSQPTAMVLAVWS